MSQDLEKEFVSVGVQSPSEFEVAPDEAAGLSVSHRAVRKASAQSRVDSVVQTQDSTCEFKPVVNKSQKTSVVGLGSDDHNEESSETLNGRGVGKVKKKRGMDKKPLDGLGTTRTTSDLERRKLEAELKATEEIAKIKQSVIEKRLELELAALQDDYNFITRPQQQSPQNNLKILGNSPEKNEKITEVAVQPDVEQSTPNYRESFMPPLTPPSPNLQNIRSPFQPPFPPPPNPYSRDYRKGKGQKTEPDFMIRNEIRGLKFSHNFPGSCEQKYPRPALFEKAQKMYPLPERGRFMQPIDKAKYQPPPQMGPNPFKPLPEEMPQMSVTEAFYADRIPERNANMQQVAEEPGCSPGTGRECNGNSIWRTIMAKVKKKFKKGPPPAWE